MGSPSGYSPVVARPAVLAADAAGFRARVVIDPSEPVLAGHYPGAPVFPGLCLVEHVRLAALAAAPPVPGGWRLAVLESCRFLSPVMPGDTLTIDAQWAPDGQDRRCSASLASERGAAARVTLRFTPAGAGEDGGAS